MKVLFVLAHDGTFRFFEPAIRELTKRGHNVTVLFIAKLVKTNVANHDRGVSEFQKQLPGVKFQVLGGKKEMSRLLYLWLALKYFLLFGKRELYSYYFYYTPGHTSFHLRKRYESYFPKMLRPIIRSDSFRAFATSRPIKSLAELIERVVTPDNRITNILKQERPNVVIASPYIFRLSFEVEAIRAAQRLKIPTAVAIQSWDNLTTKGTFPIFPDRLLVWNKALAKEAIELHGAPADRVSVIGAAVFDDWFQMSPSQSRLDTLRQVGFPQDRPYLLYLCSSTSISKDEVTLFKKVLAALEENLHQPFYVLVRPHPLNAVIWKNFHHPRVRIFPKNGAIPDTLTVKQEYFNTIYYSSGVIGVNTSAFLEASIVDRPCLTLITKKYQDTQAKLGHFAHLKNSHFLEIATTPRELAVLSLGALMGDDPNGVARRDFVHSFIRPNGLERPAAQSFADCIEALTTSYKAD